MANFGDAIQARINQLRERGANVPEILKNAQERATIRAIETAKAKTPPNDDTPLRGTNMITGDLQSSWDEDSQATPQVSGKKYTTVLANNKDYASYVNDGHRMDKHFVPGLYIDEFTGLLAMGEYNQVGGMYVGTQTDYIEGLYMKEAALETFSEVAEFELRKRVRELFNE
jgi:hypothetical protein